MSEMIERVARASFDAWVKRRIEKGEQPWGDRPVPKFEDMSASEQEFGIIHARAIITAMREPTHEMVHAAGLSDVSCHEGCGIYQDMIDAALK